MRKPFDGNLIAHTDAQLAAGRKRAQAKASWSTPKAKKLPPLGDNGTHALVERDADGRFCPRRRDDRG